MGITALGALVVCFFKEMNRKVLDTILSLSSLSGSFPQQELEKIDATFHVDGCKNYKEHYEKVKKLNQ